MTVLAVHLAVSIFIILGLFHDDLDLKKFFLLLPFGLLPDLDTFFFIHRATFHTLFFPVLLGAGYFVSSRGWRDIRGRWYLVAAAIALVLVHIALDTMSNGVFLLYPLCDVSVHPMINLYVTSSGFGSEIDAVVVGTTDTVLYIARPSQSSTGNMPIIENGVQLVILLASISSASVRLWRNHRTSSFQSEFEEHFDACAE